MAREQRRKKNSADGEESANWLTTFNDLMTLLMVFFVLLFSLSSLDTLKLESFSGALQSGMGVLMLGSKVETGAIEPLEHLRKDAADLAKEQGEQRESQGGAEHEGPRDGDEQEKSGAEGGARSVEDAVQALGQENGIRVENRPEGALITLPGEMLFDMAKAGINPESFAILEKIAHALKGGGYTIRIEGHTDSVPIETDTFPSNWELSAARAVTVLKHLMNHGVIAPERLSAVGYADTRPRASNDTFAGRARNRRVELVLSRKGKS